MQATKKLKQENWLGFYETLYISRPGPSPDNITFTWIGSRKYKQCHRTSQWFTDGFPGLQRLIKPMWKCFYQSPKNSFYGNISTQPHDCLTAIKGTSRSDSISHHLLQQGATKSNEFHEYAVELHPNTAKYIPGLWASVDVHPTHFRYTCSLF